MPQFHIPHLLSNFPPPCTCRAPLNNKQNPYFLLYLQRSKILSSINLPLPLEAMWSTCHWPCCANCASYTVTYVRLVQLIQLVRVLLPDHSAHFIVVLFVFVLLSTLVACTWFLFFPLGDATNADSCVSFLPYFSLRLSR